MMLTEQIGRCSTCHREPCTHPKVRAKTPHTGCLDWHTNTPTPFVEAELPPPEPVQWRDP